MLSERCVIALEKVAVEQVDKREEDFVMILLQTRCEPLAHSATALGLALRPCAEDIEEDPPETRDQPILRDQLEDAGSRR